VKIFTAITDAQRTESAAPQNRVVFQRLNLFPTLTAEGNLKLAERIYSWLEHASDDMQKR